MSKKQIPCAEISLVDQPQLLSKDKLSPPSHFEKQYSKERILKTTFENMKFNEFEKSAEKTLNLNNQIIERNKRTLIHPETLDGSKTIDYSGVPTDKLLL